MILKVFPSLVRRREKRDLLEARQHIEDNFEYSDELSIINMNCERVIYTHELIESKIENYFLAFILTLVASGSLQAASSDIIGFYGVRDIISIYDFRIFALCFGCMISVFLLYNILKYSEIKSMSSALLVQYARFFNDISVSAKKSRFK